MLPEGCAMCGQYGTNNFVVEDLPVGPRTFCTEKHFAQYAGLPVKESGYYGFEAEGELERKYFARFGDKRGGKEWGEYNFTWFNDVGDWKPIDKDTTGWDEDDYDSFRDNKEYDLVNQMLDNPKSSLYGKIENNTTYTQEEEFDTTYKVLNEDGDVVTLNLLMSWDEPEIEQQKIQYYDKEPLLNLEFLAESFEARGYEYRGKGWLFYATSHSDRPTTVMHPIKCGHYKMVMDGTGVWNSPTFYDTIEEMVEDQLNDLADAILESADEQMIQEYKNLKTVGEARKWLSKTTGSKLNFAPCFKKEYDYDSKALNALPITPIPFDWFEAESFSADEVILTARLWENDPIEKHWLIDDEDGEVVGEIVLTYNYTDSLRIGHGNPPQRGTRKEYHFTIDRYNPQGGYDNIEWKEEGSKYPTIKSALKSFTKKYAEYKGKDGFEAEGELERKYFARFGDKRGGKEWGEAKRQKAKATKEGKQNARYSDDIRKVVAKYRAEDDFDEQGELPEYSEDNRKMQEAAKKIIELLGKPDYTNSRREIYSSLGESYTSDMVYVLEYDVLTNEGSSMGQRMAQKLKQQGTEPWSEDRWTGSPEWPTYAAGPFHQERETFTITVSEANPVVESIVMDLYLYFADKYGVNGTGFEPTFLVVMDEEGNEVTADNLEIDNTWRDSVQGFESEETFGANNIGSLNYPSLLMFNYWKSKLPRLTYEEYVKANNLGYGLEKLLEINSVPEQCEHKNTEPDDVFIFEEDWPLGEVTQYYHIELMWQCPDCTRVGSASADYETADEFWGTDPSMYTVFWEDKTRIIPFRGDHPDNYRELPSTNEGSWSSVFGAETFEAPMNSMNQRRQIPITTPFVCSGGQSGGGCGELIDENEEWLISRLDGASYVLCNDCVDNSFHFYWVCNACGDRFCDEDLYDDGTAEDREIDDVMNSVVCNNCVASGSPFRAEDDFDEQGEPPEYITWKGKDYIYDDFEATMATPEGILYLYKTYHEPTGTVTYPIIKLYNYEGKIKEWTYYDQKEFDIEVQAQLSSIQGKVRSHKRYW